MKPLQTIAVTIGIIAIAGCGKKDDPQPADLGTDSTLQAKSQDDPETGLGSDKSIPYEFPENTKKYRLDSEEIHKRHQVLALKPLPDYIERMWGLAAPGPDSGIKTGDWAFVVPENRITDFQDYLRGLGVPEEYMGDKDAPYRHSERENWIPPDAPVDSLTFLTARSVGRNLELRGLKFFERQSRIYCFENPNLAQSELRIWFDPVTGNSFVQEVYIDPNW
ncbi:MAG: hypothetical protein WBE58_09260 [Verrucomicrobiales bacterium]